MAINKFMRQNFAEGVKVLKALRFRRSESHFAETKHRY